MDTIESQLTVRNKCDQLQKSIKELYDWEADIKKAESARTQARNEEVLPPVRSDEKSMKEFCKEESAHAEKQDQGTENDQKEKAERFKETGNKQCKLGNYLSAIDLYTQAIETYSACASYYTNRALCYMNIERYDDCLEDCNAAIAKDPNCIKAYYRRMQAYERLGENTKAIAECRKILELSKDEKEINTAKKDLARIEKRLKEQRASSPAFAAGNNEPNPTLLLVKQEADKYKELGNKQLAKKDYVTAAKHYTHAISLFDNEAIYYTNRSLCYWNLKDYDKCLADCNKAIQLDDSYFRPYYRRMQVRELRGAYQGALEDCRKFIELNKDEKQKATAEKDMLRLERLLKSEQPAKQSFVWNELKKNAKRIEFVQKPPHMRSRKPLKRVHIADVPPVVQAPKAIPQGGSTKRQTIPDAIIDQMFNNNTGERLTVPEEKTNLEHLFPAHSNKLKNMFSPPTTPSDKPKSFPSSDAPIPTIGRDLQNNGVRAAEVKTAPFVIPEMKPSDKMEKDKINHENQGLNESARKPKVPAKTADVKLSIPKSTAQFYTTWSGLSEDLRYQYLKLLANAPLNKLFGASLSNQMLGEILYILKNHFISNQMDVTNIMRGIAENECISILALMLNKEDRNAVEVLLTYMMKGQHLKEDELQRIRSKLLA
ncbi:RNA polymerase II-associated protein 3-like [Anopheles aquasalis]|uniref:RNA polymerase II-associated protein 3-like n=1 Tax=Anopheles aquasalis TaxID=42839 RepID=UPI00215B4C5B|nr:RNA polymerase II-associated protein 3-like [Anopheles aquasalis]